MRIKLWVLALCLGSVGCQDAVSPEPEVEISAYLHPADVVTITKAEYKAKSKRLLVEAYSSNPYTSVQFFGLDYDGNIIGRYYGSYETDKETGGLSFKIRQKTSPGPIYLKARLAIFVCTPVCDNPIGDSTTVHVVWRK